MSRIKFRKGTADPVNKVFDAETGAFSLTRHLNRYALPRLRAQTKSRTAAIIGLSSRIGSQSARDSLHDPPGSRQQPDWPQFTRQRLARLYTLRPAARLRVV